MLINGEQNILKNLGDFFSPYMRFSQYAVFPRKLKTHKPRTKCISNIKIGKHKINYDKININLFLAMIIVYFTILKLVVAYFSITNEPI